MPVSMLGDQPTKGYLIDLSSPTRERLTFQWNPESINDGGGSLETKAVTVVGGSHPRIIPVAGKERPISFTLYFDRDDSAKSETWVKEQVRWLQSLKYPYQRADGVSDFAAVQFIFGRLYDLTCRLTEVKAKFIDRFDSESLLPWHSEVDLTLMEISSEDIYLVDARGGDGVFTHHDPAYNWS